MSEWISIKDELPAYGEVIILKWRGVVQDVFYRRDADGTGDFFMDAQAGMKQSPSIEGLLMCQGATSVIDK